MAFYSVPYSPERCRTCRKPATVEVMTSGTMSYGYFCKRCGDARVKSGNEYLETQRDFASRKPNEPPR